MIKKFLALILISCLVLITTAPVSAQSSLRVTGSEASLNFPMDITFKISAQSNVNITDIRVRYSLKQLGFADVTAEARVSFVPATTVSAEWKWDMRYTGGLPPGTVVSYYWICKDASGEVIQTAPESLTFNDTRFSWQTITAGMITLHWYEGSQSFAQEIMSTAQEAIARLGEDTGAYLREPIRLYIYASANHLQGSMIFPQEWTGGVAFTRHSCIAIGISTLNLSWGKRAIAHELTHLVTHQMTLNPYNDVPVWLDEGLAMVNEGPMLSQFSDALNRATRNNTLFSIQTLASPFSSYADLSYLSYAQSHSVVDYLLRTYGSDKMLQLLETFRQGSTYDGALQKVYGFDTAGLNAEWRQSLGISPAPAQAGILQPEETAL